MLPTGAGPGCTEEVVLSDQSCYKSNTIEKGLVLLRDWWSQGDGSVGCVMGSDRWHWKGGMGLFWKAEVINLVMCDGEPRGLPETAQMGTGKIEMAYFPGWS